MIHPDDDFLAGGGSVVELMKSIDWRETPLGPFSSWPQSLKTATSICINSKFSMLIWWGPEYTMIYNDAYIPILADRHPKYFGKSGADAWSDIWQIIGPMLKEVEQTRSATYVVDKFLPITCAQGFVEERYFTFSYSPIRIEDGSVGGIFTAVTETTERVVQERQLRMLKDLSAHSANARTVIEACGVIVNDFQIHDVDVPFSCLYLTEGNKLVLQGITGVERNSSVSSGTIPMICDESGNSIDHNIAKAMTTAGIQILDIKRFQIKNIRECAILPIMSPGNPLPIGILVIGLNAQRQSNDTYRTFMGLVADQISSSIANAKAYEDERRRTEELKALDKAKTIFFSNISHEFRTPLTLMIPPLEDLLARAADQEKTTLDLIHRNSLRLLKLVNTLLDFSQIEAGRMQSHFEATNLTQMTSDLVSVFRAACEKENLDLRFISDTIKQPIYVDRDMWEKIVLNLISNAFKYTLHGYIEVQLRANENGVQLVVADTGVGIPKEDMPRLFERFHRVKNSQGRTHEGTGIGLAMVYELVKLHNGSIQVESTFNVGTTFYVNIPYGSPNQSSPTGPTSPHKRKYSRTTDWWIPNLSDDPVRPPDSKQTKLYRILLADDNADLRNYVSRLLSPHYQVDLASNGEQALRMCNTNPPDLLLTDVMMPKIDGFALVKKLRENDNTKNLPILLLSARAGEESKVEGLNIGADDYLVKPFTAGELMARVKSLIEVNELRLVAVRHAKEANEAKDHFLAVLSHELRTPLTPALLLAESIYSDPESPPKFRDDIGTIARNIRLEVKLIDDLLDVTRIKKGKLVLNTQTVPIREVVDHSVGIIKHDAQDKDINISVNWGAGDVYVRGDAARLQQIFWNILKNAIKFTPQGGEIAVSSENIAMEDNKSYICLKIKDNGIGFPPEFQSKIFDAFEQGGFAITHQFGGLGLGMSISMALAKMHHGQLKAESEGIGKGATFTVLLPTVVTSPRDLYIPMQKPQVDNEHVLEVLIVDDNKPTLMVLQRFVQKMGYRVTCGMSVSEAVLLASKTKFDLLISDIGLPDGSGLDVVKKIKEMYPIKAIALSGYGMEEDIEKSLQAGFDDHLIKPVQSDLLRTAIYKLLYL